MGKLNIFVAPSFDGDAAFIKRSKPLYWQFNRARGLAKVAVRDGQWKLASQLSSPWPVRNADITLEGIKHIKSAKLERFELYNVTDDIGETNDLSSTNVEVFDRLKAPMQAIFREVQAEAPEWPAWKWPRHESSKIQWPEYWLNRKKNTGSK